MAWNKPSTGDTVAATDITQLINNLDGTVAAGEPIKITKVNSASQYALDVKNVDVTNSYGLRVRDNADGDVFKTSNTQIDVGLDIVMAAAKTVDTLELSTHAHTGAAGHGVNIAAAGLAADAVETAKIKNLAVTAAKMATGTITATQLASNAVTTVKIPNLAVTGAKIANGTITVDQLANNAVTMSKLMNLAVTAAKMATNAVETTKIVNLAVTAAKMASATITVTQLANNAVETAKIANLAVTGAKMANGTITVDQLANNAVTMSKIYNLAVTGAKIANATITVTQLANDAVETAKIANLNVTAAKIANRTRRLAVGIGVGRNETDGTPIDRSAVYGLIFPDAKACAAYAYLCVPSDFLAGGTFTVKAVVRANAAGNLYSEISAVYGAENEGWTTHTAGAGYEVTACGNATIECVNSLVLANIAAGDFVGILFRRDGLHASDTLSAILDFAGWYIDYQADS